LGSGGNQNLTVSEYRCTDMHKIASVVSDVAYKCRNITYAAIACNSLTSTPQVPSLELCISVCVYVK